jgi:5-methylcytosine-specific restriction endonuclease McrA
MLKKCTKCGKEKALFEYNSASSSSDGKRPDCRGCKKEYDNERYRAHGDRLRLQMREYGASHAEENRKRARDWGKEHRERSSARLAAWREENPKANRLLRRVHKQTRRARAQAGGSPSPNHIGSLLGQAACTYCDVLFNPFVFLLTMTVDHVLSLAKGGTNHKRNLVAVCRRCNTSKGDRALVLEWLPSGVVRERTYTAEEVAEYCRAEAENQRALLSAENNKKDLAV